MEKRKFSKYEQIMLTSAYNLRKYCNNTNCEDCIFKVGVSICILTTPDNPWNWELDKANKKEGEAE